MPQTLDATTAPTSVGVESDEGRLVGSDRVLAVLGELSRHPAGVGLDELARIMGSPKSSVHRGLASLRRAGLADQDDRGRYLLGDEFVRMAFAYHEARPDQVRVRPVLEELAARFGETVHYTVLDGRTVVYRAKVDPPTGAVRLTSTVGGRNPAHSTAAGKLLLSYRLQTRSDVAAWAAEEPLVRRTERTHTTADALQPEFELIRGRGFGTDDQENEPGVNCLALPVFLTSPSAPSGAVSVSAIAYRTPMTELISRVDDVRLIIGALGAPVR
ncbi:IclR family transcriptional regulator [Microbacterium sp. cf046]|uniref:IclR family transcriptional regulator n=1 Tax=Microbacterium sp. cf046 TaxID=1761803 RepID=UPI001C317FA4|nr:IclR family transcriptional regulator [Microbacterium sp. cf046]